MKHIISHTIFVALVAGGLGSTVPGCSAGSAQEPTVQSPQIPQDALQLAASEDTVAETGVNAWGITIDQNGATWATGYDAESKPITRISFKSSVGSEGVPEVNIAVAFPESAQGSLTLKFHQDRMEGVHTFLEHPEGLKLAEAMQRDVGQLDLSGLNAAEMGKSLAVAPTGTLPIALGQSNPIPNTSTPLSGTSTPLSKQGPQLVALTGICLINGSGRGCGGKLLATLGSCGATLLTCAVALGTTTASAGCTTVTLGACSFTIPIPLIAAGACGFSSAGCIGNITDLNDQGCGISTTC